MKMMDTKRDKSRRLPYSSYSGFTLIELLVALGIMALMALALHGRDPKRRSSVVIMALAAIGTALCIAWYLVPGMPVGSPGMDGPVYNGRKDPYDVLLVLKDGSSRIFQGYR